MGLSADDVKKLVENVDVLRITSLKHSNHLQGVGLGVGDIGLFKCVSPSGDLWLSFIGFALPLRISPLDVELPNITWDDLKTASKVDNVNHPKHYTSDECGVEAIELTSLLPNCIGNALKYVWRCGKKDDSVQELKKALWYVNYSIDNDLPSTIDDLSDTPHFEDLIKKVKSSWVGDKYIFIDAVYWGDQQLMKTALERMISEVEK